MNEANAMVLVIATSFGLLLLHMMLRGLAYRADCWTVPAHVARVVGNGADRCEWHGFQDHQFWLSFPPANESDSLPEGPFPNPQSVQLPHDAPSWWAPWATSDSTRLEGMVFSISSDGMYGVEVMRADGRRDVFLFET